MELIIFLVACVITANLLHKAGKRKSGHRSTWNEPRRRSKRVHQYDRKRVLAPQFENPVKAASKIAPDGFRYAPDEEWPFEKRRLITDTELILFHRLREALPNHYIFTQVQLSQLVRIKKGHSFQVWFSRIRSMSVDFVVTDKSLNTIAAIELDDKSHYDDEQRHAADLKKDKVLTSAGIRVIRWRCEVMPSKDQILLSFPEIERKCHS
ncbi:DUF2726 domain-containing protein [Pseudomonas abyssi]|uniref:DUF2726 domain-containing protein n=1 Tax=Pseudomonas abyssi TaxID=170540 RepID=UPI003C7D437E